MKRSSVDSLLIFLPSPVDDLQDKLEGMMHVSGVGWFACDQVAVVGIGEETADEASCVWPLQCCSNARGGLPAQEVPA